MLDLELARALHEAGLPWEPCEGDRFILPDHDLDGRVFTISEMVVEVRRSPVGDLIAFNGTTEWALDAIEQAEAVWIPREEQLRESLGTALLSLARLGDTGWRCTYRASEDLREVETTTAVDAYGRALLDVLTSD
ncbi:MAG: hypothetical protein JJT89_12965 [Nitriliruptoraceae bacterium]|nr:hypothetical protein [Nitriliruptoraceae bacterium]